MSNRKVVIPNGFFGTGSDKILKVDNLVSPEEIENILSIVDDPKIWNHESKNTTWINRIADGNVLLRTYPDILEIIGNVQTRLSYKISKFYDVELGRPDRSIVRWFPGNYQLPHADNTYYPNYHIGSIIYINSDYEGGELFFPQHEITLKPVSGQAFAFPGDDHYLHGVNEVTQGMRYTIPTFWKVISYSRDWQKEEWLKNQYIVMGRSVKWISEIAGVHPDLIRFYLDQYKIIRPLPKCEHGFVSCKICKVYQ